jgi:hypothetical protein
VGVFYLKTSEVPSKVLAFLLFENSITQRAIFQGGLLAPHDLIAYWLFAPPVFIFSWFLGFPAFDRTRPRAT